jgi:hypothetical protein
VLNKAVLANQVGFQKDRLVCLCYYDSSENDLVKFSKDDWAVIRKRRRQCQDYVISPKVKKRL